MTELTKKHCEACSGDTPALKAEEVFRLHEQVREWDVTSGRKLVRRFEFEDFVEAMKFVNRVADLAEEEGHHPNISIDYKRVTFTVWTHAIDDLSESDFILAAKIDELYGGDDA
ncbi:MAG TPA: 4a-hydroxytetrahydrobiopterin dehydratase [Gemmatimonadota bacterium]|jgi:4a-hydroxytetrahydrobiopterin dehydratase|nr:4a-hydroxytetrahydrobiopterin dehydratase [Gemmatimonadota bacterium]